MMGSMFDDAVADVGQYDDEQGGGGGAIGWFLALVDQEAAATYYNNNSSNNHSSGPQWSDVIRNKDGSVRDPAKINTLLFIIDCTCVIIGLPLNLYIAIKIMFKRRLYSKPRNIFQLSFAFCNIFSLAVTNILEIIYHSVLTKNETICLFYVSFGALPCFLFFFNLLLSLIDRYVAMYNPLWHRRKVTVKNVIFWLLILNLALAVGVKWIYVGQHVPLRCEIQVRHIVTVQAVQCVLFVLCICFHITDYVKTCQLLPQPSGIVSVPRISRRRAAAMADEQEEAIEMDERRPPPQLPPPQPPAPPEERLNIHMGRGTVAQLEMEATRTFLAGVIPLLILPLPWLVLIITHSICLVFYGETCNDFIWLAGYFKGWITLHSLVNPIMNLCRNKELSSTPRSNVGIEEELFN